MFVLNVKNRCIMSQKLDTKRKKGAEGDGVGSGGSLSIMGNEEISVSALDGCLGAVEEGAALSVGPEKVGQVVVLGHQGV